MVHGGELLPKSKLVAYLWVYAKEISLAELGSNFNSLQDLLCMRVIGINLVVPPPRAVISVRWTPPAES